MSDDLGADPAERSDTRFVVREAGGQPAVAVDVAGLAGDTELLVRRHDAGALPECLARGVGQQLAA